ncbi:hypothetical protein CVT26_010688 [Gymnopilus dilepis]|uniref:Uncharacterized protein n=1 Tax=Gymnopilus dilepis TaxID=231916 RepID=A0A409Y0Z6_9AGAR|nr:hypothetical protein CVT26_010688 [Gymnopilus dilepis]
MKRRNQKSFGKGKMERLSLPSEIAPDHPPVPVVQSRSTTFRVTDDGRQHANSQFVDVHGVEINPSVPPSYMPDETPSYFVHDWNDRPAEVDDAAPKKRKPVSPSVKSAILH